MSEHDEHTATPPTAHLDDQSRTHREASARGGARSTAADTTLRGGSSTTAATSTDEHRDTVAEVMRDTRIAVLTYTDAEGRLVATPMGTQDFEDPSRVWFITAADSDKVQAIQQRPAVNVFYSADSGWVSLSGSARVNHDRAQLEQLWDPSASMFMEGGPENPDNVLLEVDGDTAQLWESPGRVGFLVQMVKGLVTDDTPGDDSDAPIVNL